MDIKDTWYKLDTLKRLIAFIVIFNLSYWLIGAFVFGFEINVAKYIAFSPKLPNSLFKFWTYISYIFLHKSLWHLAMNMIVLWITGRIFMRYYGFRSLLALFLMGGIAGALTYQIVYCLVPSGTMLFIAPMPLLGSSASIYCLVFAYVFREPEQELRISHEYAIPYIYMAYGFLLLLVLSVLFLDSNIGGDLAHLGGAGMGMAYAFLIRERGKDISEPFAKAIDWLIIQWEGLIYKLGRSQTSQKRKINIERLEEIERKMRHSGYRSLNEEERKILLEKENKE